MGRVLAVNVAVDDKMYGPDYPGPVPDDVAAKIGDHCWADSDAQAVEAEPVQAAEPNAGELDVKPLADRSKAELVDVATAHDVDSSGTKAKLLERLQAAGIEG